MTEVRAGVDEFSEKREDKEQQGYEQGSADSGGPAPRELQPCCKSPRRSVQPGGRPTLQWFPLGLRHRDE